MIKMLVILMCATNQVQTCELVVNPNPMTPQICEDAKLKAIDILTKAGIVGGVTCEPIPGAAA